MIRYCNAVLGFSDNIYRDSASKRHAICLCTWLYESWALLSCQQNATRYLVVKDRDSIFTTSDLSGIKFYVSDGKYKAPVELANKGYGDLALFRSKLYMLFTKEQQERLAAGKEIMSLDPVFARHAWPYWLEDYFKLYHGTLTELDTRFDIKHTMNTRTKSALKIIKGGWRVEIRHVDLTTLGTLHGDTKRVRGSSDSYKLVQDRKSANSRAWSFGELLINRALIELDKESDLVEDSDFDEEY